MRRFFNRYSSPEPVKRLWAPWRQEFLESESKECIFCKLPAEGEKKDKENLILLRLKHTFLIMNKYPYNSGHIMVAPYRHLSTFNGLKRLELLELMEGVNISCKVLQAEYGAEGFNVGANLGRTAGAGYEHLHVHVVPRWNGDTNFMPVLADTKVLPEHLDETYTRLKAALQKMGIVKK
ncbi:MAG: HIT domain-containing protein [Conexivisphaerales archaeon]